MFAQNGFDVNLGNPPWEMPEVDDREFFASRCPGIAREESARKRSELISALGEDDPILHAEWTGFLRRHEGIRAFIAGSGRYPNAGSGRLNLSGSWLNLDGYRAAIEAV